MKSLKAAQANPTAQSLPCSRNPLSEVLPLANLTSGHYGHKHAFTGEPQTCEHCRELVNDMSGKKYSARQRHKGAPISVK